MKKLVTLSSSIALLFFASCNHPKVQLPDASYTQLDKVNDYSAIYFFENEETKSIEINDKNRIGTTDWIFHIEKSLKLSEVVPELVRFQEKRKNASHNKEGAQHYFSYRDTSNNSLAFAAFTDLNFAFNTYFSSLYVREHTDYHENYNVIRVNIIDDKQLFVDGYAFETVDAFTYINELILMNQTSKPHLVYLNASQDATFGDYFQAWMALQNIENVNLSPIHFIYDANLIENCECK
jgi:hypothetical protein